MKPNQTKVERTPEEIAAIAIKRAEIDLAAKQRVEELQAYEDRVESMSHRQLRGEFRRMIRAEHAGKPPVPQPGLNIAYATVMLTVLENSETMDRRLRRDQVNPVGKRMYPI